MPISGPVYTRTLRNISEYGSSSSNTIGPGAHRAKVSDTADTYENHCATHTESALQLENVIDATRASLQILSASISEITCNSDEGAPP